MSNQVKLPDRIYITESVLNQIEQEIYSRPPEQGGALLGPPGLPTITRFVYDSWGHTTGVSYFPSDELVDLVPKIELNEDLELKGIIHSHPAGIAHPSGQDIHGPFTRALNENAHLSYFLGPILVHSNAPLGHHCIKCGNGTIAFHIAYRDFNKIKVQPIQCQVISDEELKQQTERAKEQKLSLGVQQFSKDLKQLANFFSIKDELAVIPIEVNGRSIYGVQIPLSSKFELTLFIGESYPFTPPIAIISDISRKRCRNVEQLYLVWDLDTPLSNRLLDALNRYFYDKVPERMVYGLQNFPCLTEDRATAELAGWNLSFSRNELTSDELYTELRKRSTGILSQEISSKRVLVVGLGSVGSYLSELLVRSGVGHLTLVDPESVEAVNLSRTVYEVGDIGKPKVDAAARRLLNINPKVQLNRLAVNLTHLSHEKVDQLVTESDLVVAVTDDHEAQRALNRFAYARGKPAVFVGIYAKANGGEVIYTLPEITPCYLCATRSRTASEDVGLGGNYGLGVDYSTGRLIGEVGLAADIQHVSSAACKIALALLLNESEGSKIQDFIRVPASKGKNYVVFSNTPNFWIFSEVMSKVAGQHTYQSLWLKVNKNEDCDVCGNNRRDPMKVPMKSPELSDLRIIYTERKNN